jgi:hypothetical protein
VGERLLDTAFALLAGQIQDPHILPVGTARLLRHQGVVGAPIGHGRIQILPVHVPRKRSGLPHQPADDVPVVDVMLVLAPQAWHPLHQLLGVPDLDLLQADPCLDLLATQPRRHRVGVVFHPDRAATPHAHPHALQGLQALRRQRPQVRQLRGYLGRSAGIAPRLHGQDELPVVLPAGKIAAATQQQGLFHRLLEVPMRRLHVPILMPAGRVRGLGVQAVVGQ